MHQNFNVGRASELDNSSDRKLYRFFEIMPGFLAWATLILVIVLSFTNPVFIAFFIIAFDVYWFVKTIYLSLHLRVSYSRLRKNTRINWYDKLQQLPPQRFTLSTLKSWQDVYHLVFLPVYKEEYDIISTSLEAILNAEYPKSKIAIVLCWEERGGEEIRETVDQIERHYKNQFLEFASIMHPRNLVGEIPGKGSNTAYAARIIKENFVDRLGIPCEHIIVSNFDIDTVCHPQYFAILTHTFLTTPNPLRASYQPVPLYVNNIWEAPSFARVVAFAATFWHTIKQERTDSATTFSSHSMPFKALVDVDYWQKNMVNEDSRIFWQCFLRYDGDYRVVPLYFPVSMDANVASTNFQTFKNIYKQQRRWGYGAENIPYFLFGFIKNKAIPRSKKWFYGFMVMESFHSWATNAILLFVLGWLPVIVGGPEFNQTVLSFNLPYLTRLILTFSMIGLITTAILSMIILPPRPLKYGRFKYLWMFIQWILFPATTIFLGAIPGLEAQTRLMLGKYMGFWATPKIRSKTVIRNE